jgi:hypothetical protein
MNARVSKSACTKVLSQEQGNVFEELEWDGLFIDPQSIVLPFKHAKYSASDVSGLVSSFIYFIEGME